MIKISALNDESEEESDSEVEVSREALEQIALQQYAKALDLQRKGNLTEATQLLRDLLDTELLYDVKKPAPGEKVSGPLFNLKYLCYKNLASILTTSGDIEGAIEAYNSAAELDDTDITLWHRLGNVCLQAKHYETALYAFQKGVERNPRHWPCLDKLIIVLLGLNYKEQCLATIHDALQLDPGYLRGLVYRKHIYKIYKHMREYMEGINPIYKWEEDDNEVIDEEKAEKLLKDAEIIHEEYIEQQKAESYKYIVPNLKLKKPISRLTWQSVGESLVHMHNYITENCFSHACFVEISSEIGDEEEKMDVCEDQQESDDNKAEENNTDNEKITETGSENENNDLSDKDKAADSEKVESSEMVISESTTENAPDSKAQKKAARRRGNVLNDLKQWGWYERKSVRKKPVDDDKNIYETLRRMVPLALVTDVAKKKENQAKENSPEFLTNIEKLFDENVTEKLCDDTVYFGTEREQNDVKSFIDKYTENSRDIIDLLKDYLSILAKKWRSKWPDTLQRVFVDANKCYSTHIDVPACTDDNKEDLLHYTSVNMLAEEFMVNEKINSNSEEKVTHELNVNESIEIILTLKPHIYFSTDCLEMILRSLWLRLHIHILNRCEELALDCAYQLLSEFDAMGEYHDNFSLNIPNFTFKTDVNEYEILGYIKFLERNKKLATVMNLYKRGSYEEVLSIVIESFEHCKTVARTKEEDMPLDFPVQLSLILDSYWALNKIECCFKWSLICLHEALKHYFRLTSGSSDYEKWSLTVIKILSCMEHILSTEGLSCLESVTQDELGQGLEDLIRIIGHQVETNATEMPFNTVTPWIIMHYILQREEDQGRSRSLADSDKIACDEVPNPLMVLFIAHEQLGERSWCCKSDGKLLYFILDTVVPRLQSPSLAKSLEQIIQYMEQCVFCLYGHPGKKMKKYLVDHAVTPHTLDWKRAQQIYEIFRPTDLPPLEGKLSGISADTETLFLNILSLLPAECDPSKYVPQMKKYIKGVEQKLPPVPPLLPYKMKDIYFLLGDYYFKKNETKLAIKYNTLDVVINNDRFKSWAQISLAKASNLERYLNSYRKINNEKEFLGPANTAIRCFKRTLELDPSYRYMWIEFGNFVYTVHSFCSRLLKQATESMDMGEFKAFEKQKEDLLDLTYKCFITLRDDLNSSYDSDNEESWLLYYMLGKVAEKRNNPPSVYLNFYLQGIKNLQEAGAIYPSKINYSNSSTLSIEVLELHYRLHASILKYIEQHENTPIPASIGKVFTHCIEEWEQSPYMRKRKKDNVPNAENDNRVDDAPATQTHHAANILKRSISDAGEEDNREAKRLKLESAAAKVRRSASYDTERFANKEPQPQPDVSANDNKDTATIVTSNAPEPVASKETPLPAVKSVVEQTDKLEDKVPQANIAPEEDKKQESSSSSSSTSSSDSNSSESSSDSSSESSKDTDASSKSAGDSKPLTDEEIKKIASACLDALEDCASRYTPHYKALYRLAHYHFYYKKGKDIERCRDLMLSTFTSRCDRKKMTGLFAERKPSNFFNNIWKLGSQEVERAGGFPFHMNRSVLLTLEILKEIDDHKTLLDLSTQLQRTPDLDKKYLNDSDREELATQAFSLCVQSLKGQLQKFSQQADIKSNNVERQALKCLMIDIYKAHQRVLKNPKHANQFVNLLVDAYKLVSKDVVTENTNLAETSLKYVSNLKQQATQASIQKKQAAKPTVAEPSKTVTVTTSQPKPDPKPSAPSASASCLPKMSPHEMAAAFQNYVPMLNDPILSQLSLSYMSALAGYPIQNNLQSSLQSSLQNSFQAEFYRQFMSQNFSSFMQPQKKQKRAPKQSSTSRNVSHMKNVITSKTHTGSTVASSTTKSYIGSATSISKSYTGSSTSTTKSYSGSTNMGTKSYTGSTSIPSSGSKSYTASSSIPSGTKSFTGSTSTASSTKAAPTPVITSLQKSASTLAPSMGTVLSSLPASMTSNLSSFGASSSHTSGQTSAPHAHMSSSSSTNTAVHPKPPMPHQQVSPGKTLQEKLAERQKSIPSAPKDINASISRLPSSLTITKTSSSKQHLLHGKRPEPKKTLTFEGVNKPRPISSDEVIVLDDD